MHVNFRRASWFCPFIVLLLLAPLSALAQLKIAPVEFEKEILDNGLRVIYAPLHQAPVVHVRVLYHVGSRDEQADRQGFAHMFEHMMFRGSAHVAPEQHMKLIGIVGGNSNAFTSFDQTTYVNTIPANATEMALYLEADRMASFKVNDQIFQTERKVVSEEWRLRYANQPLGPMYQDLSEIAFQKHSYHWTPIGDMEQLRRASSSELQQFFNTYYVPNNACLIVAGDIDIPQTKQWVRRYFGWIPKGGDVPRNMQQEPQQTETRRKIVEKPNVPLVNMYLGFKNPGYKSDDHYALSLLGDILSSGAAGILDRKFVNSADPSCLDVGAGDQQLEDPSMFIVNAVVDPRKDPDAVMKEILSTVYEVAEKGVSQEDLDKAKTIAMRSIVSSRETCTDIAAQLGEEEVFGGDANRVNTMVAKIQAITPTEIQAVARIYLKPEHLSVLQYRPPAVPVTELLRASAATQAAIANQTANAGVVPSTQPIQPRAVNFPSGYPTQPPFNKNVISVTLNKGVESNVNGLRVITLTDSRLPLVSMNLVMPGGSDSEPRGKVGLGGMTAQMMSRGADGISFIDFSKDLENRGISLNAADASDSTRINISCMSDQIEHAVMRANQMLTKPMLPQEEFDKFKSQSIAGLMQSLSNPGNVVNRELISNLYPGSTLGRITTRQTLEAITLDDVKKWYQQFYQLDGAMLIVAGDVSVEKSKELATKLIAGLDRKNRPAPADYSLKQPQDKRRIILVDNPDGKQATIRMAIRAYDIHTDEKFAGSVAGTILSAGIDSRLNKYVRAEKGLTYGCASYFRPTRHAGSFDGQVDTNPDTAAAAIEAMLKVYGDMMSANVTDQELIEAQSRVAGSACMDVQTISQQASRRMEQILNDYPIDYYDVYPKRIAEVKPDQVRQVLDKYVDPNRMLFVIVAPASVVKDQLEKLGTVEVLPMPLKREQPSTTPAGQ
jgi:zinc protease